MEVLARLLERGDRQVLALVRAPDGPAAEQRLDGVLRTLWRDPEPYRHLVRAIPGDLTRPGLGLSPVDRNALAEDTGAVLHCAASISFDLPLEEARAINVEGTREVIGLAREMNTLGRLERFVHVSTAYVSGTHPSTFRERQLSAGQTFRNTYEQTKWEAEHIVAGARDLAPAIARPSIVVGESDSGWTPAFNVLYWPLRAFSRGLFDAVPARPEGRVDVVPVDYVADALVHLLDRHDQGVFNLVAGRGAVDGGGARRALLPALRTAGAAARAAGWRHVRDGRRPRRGLRALLRHAGRLRRRPRAPRAGARGDPRAAAGGLLRAADRLRRGRALGQGAAHARGGAGARVGDGRGLRSASSAEWSLSPASRHAWW